MKKRSILLVLLAVMVGMAMIMTACGKEEMTLEKYVEGNADVEQSIEDAMSGSNVLVEIKGNDIVYTFDLASMDGYTEELAKSDAVKEALETALDGAKGTFGNISKSIEESTEIQGINTIVNYTWGDEVIVSKTFTSADAA